MSKRTGLLTTGVVTSQQRREVPTPVGTANSQRQKVVGAPAPATQQRRTVAAPAAPVADDVIEDLRTFGGSLAALADLLPLSEENAAWLRSQRLKEPADDVHVRARVDSELMKHELGITDQLLRHAVVNELHYRGFAPEFVNRILASGAGAKINGRADSILKAIRADPQTLAKYLARLPQTI